MRPSASSYELFIALRYLRSKRRTRFVSVITYISVGGVMVGVAALVIVLSLFNGFESEVRERITGERAHINVYSIYNRPITGYETLVQRIMNIDHVVSAAPYVYEKAVCAIPGESNSTSGVIVVGLDPERETQMAHLKRNIVFGSLDFKATAEPDNPESAPLPGLVIGRGLADALGVVIGQKIALANFHNFSLTAAIMPYVRLFRVSGISESGFYEYDASFVYIHLEEAQKLFRMEDGVNGLAVRVDDRDRARAIADDIETDLNGFAAENPQTSVASEQKSVYFTVDWMQQHRQLFRWMTLEKWASFAILNLIILVAAFNIASTLIMVALEKTKDIGILKSMGATARSLMKIFILQGSIVGILGALVGCLIGFLICWLQATFKFISLPPDIYLIDALPIQMAWPDFVSVAIGAMVISVLAAVYPAWKAATLPPVEAIRYE